MPLTTRQQQGFVYGEVLLAIALVGSALVALVTALTTGFDQTAQASDLALAERLQREAYLLIEGESLEATRARDGLKYAPPLLASGAATSLHPGYAQSLRAAWVPDPDAPAVTQADPAPDPAIDHLLVTVQVLGPRGLLSERTWIRSRR